MARARSEQAPVATARTDRSPLHRKLSWLTFFRLVMVTVLLGGTAITTWDEPGEVVRGAAPLYGLVVGIYLASLGLAVLLRAGRGELLIAYAQIALDVAVAATVVTMTGHAESVFVFLFLLGIVNGSILLFRRGAVAATLLAIGVYGPIALLGPRPASALTFYVHVGAFLATAALASYLAELLRRTGERLEEREEDLAAITALHEAIVQSVPSGIVTVDESGRVTFANRAAETILGVPAASLAGQPDARVPFPFQADSGRDETSFSNARGDRLRVGYTVSRLVGRGGERLGSAVIFQDLTRLREMEDAMKRSERLADLGELAAGLAHELRNPLASMTGSIELIRSRQPTGSDDEKLTDIVLREAERLNVLVTRFLDFSRPAPPRRIAVDLGVLLRDTVAVFQHHPAAAAVRLEQALEPAVAAADPDQLRQVAWNLVLNAAEAMSEQQGGTLRIASGAGPDGTAVFTVADSGPGIPEADRCRLFQPFFTTKRRGSGLGLAIVHRVIDAHGGAIEVETAPGRGTAVRVRLPAFPPELA
jgi:two-component system, NtrC family, sensor histidine kinase PilS